KNKPATDIKEATTKRAPTWSKQKRTIPNNCTITRTPIPLAQRGFAKSIKHHCRTRYETATDHPAPSSPTRGKRFHATQKSTESFIPKKRKVDKNNFPRRK